MRNQERNIGFGLRLAALMTATLLLVACARTTVVREEPPRPSAADVGDRVTGARADSQGAVHRVQSGDTLYEIAFRAGIDWRDLARWNGIVAPYVIRPGQVLRLGAVSPSATSGVVGRVVSAGPPPIPRGPAVAATAEPATTEAAAVPAASLAPTGPGDQTAFRAGQWQWPTQGQVVSRFAAGDRARQGIAIAGSAGQPVRAAAAGTVVYSGAGLVGYGELIIIKHSDEWLSAYGHNRRRLVAEGAHVAAGQQIAELGRTGTSRDMLHFEIRRNGRPVDPTPLLPAR